MKYNINKEKNSELEIEVTVPSSDFATYWNEGIKAIQKEVEVDGFRKGQAPENAIIAKYGETGVLQEMANIMINKTYPEVIIKEKIHILGEPNIHVVKLAKDEDFIYHAHVPVYPVITLPDYKKIASDILDEVKNNPEKKITDISNDDLAKIMEGLSEEIKKETPDLENKIRENVKLEKELMQKNENRTNFMESVVKSVNELNVDTWPKNFEDRDKAQVIALEIAKKENIKVTDEEVDTEVIKLMMHIPHQDVATGKIDEARVKAYANQIITNEKMFVALGI